MNYLKWSFMIILFLVFMGAQESFAAQPIKIAFIRNHHLWIKVGNKERQLTDDEKVIAPKWSFDGEWLAYEKGGQLWVYELSNQKHYLLYQGSISNYQWSPKQNILAFQLDSVLNTVDMNQKKKNFVNVALGVGNYSWTPDGKGFLASSTANLLPTGWSSVELFHIPLNTSLDKKKVQHFFTLPKESNDFFAIGTSIFKWSPDGKWIAFLAEPTASWSMDSNTLCLIRSDGKEFMKVDKMLINNEWFKWAPTINRIAYIEGEGRMAIENKHLKVKDLPAISPNSFTPKGYVDWDFTWHNNELMTISRAKEMEWSNDPKKRPLPSLYQVDIQHNDQKKMTLPQKNEGDFHPEYIKTAKKLVWLRSNRENTNMWIANSNGTNSSILVRNIDTVTPYYEKWNWDEVMDIY